MKHFDTFLKNLLTGEKLEKMAELLEHVEKSFPQLKAKVSGLHPMFVDKGIEIVGFTIFDDFILVTTDAKMIERFQGSIEKAGYMHERASFRIGWDDTIRFDLLDDIIKANWQDKQVQTRFWR
ncbi:hypothetical protein [Lacticigenium naphthae]|uniref:hypothetical protein n=1 Tax=Lacticigenium naphthae TaxID=515351 RepID=UPI00041B9921|nr:hypothetical protein [Lacticigenium naphthae]